MKTTIEQLIAVVNGNKMNTEITNINIRINKGRNISVTMTEKKTAYVALDRFEEIAIESNHGC